MAQEQGGLSGYTLKMIAIITMLIDHIGYMMYYLYYLFSNKEMMRVVMSSLRVIGRISFPLFCFLIVEGFCHTRSVKRYGLRLLVFSIISEIPYDLAFYRGIYWDAQNVFFTLLIGLMVLYGIEKAKQNYVIQAVVTVLGCALSILIKSDYTWAGVMIIVVLYYFRECKKIRLTVGAVLMAYSSRVFGYGMAALSSIPIHFYNGTRGKDSLKYFFYWFYPVHLLILYGITEIIMKRF